MMERCRLLESCGDGEMERWRDGELESGYESNGPDRDDKKERREARSTDK